MKVKDQTDVKVTRTVCASHCGDSCGILAHVKDGVLTKVEPAEFPEPGYRFACRGSLCSPRVVYHPDRLKYPLKRTGKRGEGKWQRITWDEALDTIASRLKDIAAKYGPESVAYLNGGITLPAGGVFIGQRFASVSGATWVSPQACAMAAQICADTLSTGVRFSDPYHCDHENPGLFVYWGSNVVASFPMRYRRRVRPARERGAKVVVINPLFTATAAKADQWIPIRPGTDTALALGMINVVVSEGLCDEAFLIKHTVGPFLVRSDNGLFMRGELSSGDSTGKYMVWDTKTNTPQAYDTPEAAPALRGSYRVDGIECKPAFQLLAELVEQYPLDKVSEITEIAPDVIRNLALDYTTLGPVVSERGMSLNRTFYGDLTYRAITTLAAVTGNLRLKRPERDFFGALNWGDFMFPGGRRYNKVTSSQFYENHLTGKPYPIKALWVSTHNPANSHPNRNNFKELMLSMDFNVVVDLFISATAEYADIVLPGCTAFECTNVSMPYSTFMGGFSYVQMQPKVIEPYYESKSDLEIYTELAQRMGFGEFFDKSAEQYIEMLLSSGHPSLEGITLEKIRETPMNPKPCSVPALSTPSGRIEFYVEKLKDFGQELPVYMEPPESPRQPLAQKYPLTLLQTHARHRHHSHFGNVDWLKELDPEPVLEMNPIDAERRGIQDGDMIVTFNDRGRVKLKAMIHEGVRPGVVTLSEGWQPNEFAEGSHQELTGPPVNRAQQAIFESVGHIQGVLVEVRKTEEG